MTPGVEGDEKQPEAAEQAHLQSADGAQPEQEETKTSQTMTPGVEGDEKQPKAAEQAHLQSAGGAQLEQEEAGAELPPFIPWKESESYRAIQAEYDSLQEKIAALLTEERVRAESMLQEVRAEAAIFADKASKAAIEIGALHQKLQDGSRALDVISWQDRTSLQPTPNRHRISVLSC